MRPWICDFCKKQVNSYGVYIREGWHEHKYIGGKADLCSLVCLKAYLDQLIKAPDPIDDDPFDLSAPGRWEF